MSQLKSALFSATNLRDGGYLDSLILASGYPAFNLRLANYTVANLKEANYTATNLRDGGYLDILILAAGYLAADLKEANYTAANLRDGGYSDIIILAAGYTATDLRLANYTIDDLQSVPYSTSDILAAGYSEDELKAAGLYTSPVTPIICFNEDSKILCLVDGEEKEILIQNIRNGHLVKTLYDGYKPVCMIGTSVIDNPGTNERIKNRLFICKKEKYPELNEDLIITGCHSILVDEITELQRQEIIVTMGRIFITDRKYRLNAILDDRAEPYNCSGKFNIYHIALENENYYSNYGIYANGLLVESCGQRAIKKFANMTFL